MPIFVQSIVRINFGSYIWKDSIYWISKLVNIVRVNPDHGRDLSPLADHDKINPLADHMITKGEIREFSAFPSSPHLMFDQTLTGMLQWILGRFDFSQNKCEMRPANKYNVGRTFTPWFRRRAH